MTRHILKLVWNRKRTNALLVAEIFASFLVVFAVTVLAVVSYTNLKRPLGFEWRNTWDVDIDMKLRGESVTPEKARLLAELHRTVAALDGVEAVAGAAIVPYTFSTMESRLKADGKQLQFEMIPVTDRFADVMGVKLTAGRWFSREDDGAALSPVVVNEYLARYMWGTANPIGKLLADTDETAPAPYRVVGVIEDFRKAGELQSPRAFLFDRAKLEPDAKKTADPTKQAIDRSPRLTNIVLRVRPGMPPAFEETLVKALLAAAPDWSFEVRPFADARDSTLRLKMVPLVGVALVAAFLLAMVGLGLIGVLWQNVTQRTREIGLRRAKGASRGAILTQILGELLVVTSFGLVLGLLLVVQVPLLHALPSVSGGVYAAAIALSVVAMLLFTTLCGLYPGWLATRVTPAEALRDE